MILIVFLLMWAFLCPLIASSVASSKGRSGCAWFLLGIFFGPITLLAAAVMSPDYRALDERATRQSRVREQKEQESADQDSLPENIERRLKQGVLTVSAVGLVIFLIYIKT